MSPTFVISAILTLLAGIGIFLIACSMMSSNLESVSSSKLRSMFAKVSGSKWLGVGIGAVATAAIQSSGATTVMVIGFVNAGIMSLVQAATIIFGANIGTTITGQIVALGMFGGNMISTTVIFSAMAGIGAFIMTFAKKDIVKKVGGILAGFGMLFVGLSMMSNSMESFAELDSVKMFLAGIKNPLLLVLVGAVLTAIIQSSSVMTSVAITMLFVGLITLDQGIYLTMGSNIGSCVVAIIAGMTSGTNAKRTALIHLLFNTGGVIVFLVIGLLLGMIPGRDLDFGSVFGALFPNAPQTQLAMFHTFFNCLAVLLFLPFTEKLVALVERLVPEHIAEEAEGEKETARLYYVDEHMLSAPPLAVQQVKKEIMNMADIAMRNFSDSLYTMRHPEAMDMDQFRANEDELNFLNKKLTHFLVKLFDQNLSVRDKRYISTAFHTLTDLERVGDYAKNVVEYMDLVKESGSSFSEAAINEIRNLQELLEKLYDATVRAYVKRDLEALEEAKVYEQQMDDMTEAYKLAHVDRLNEDFCDPEIGANYMTFLSNVERVADHYFNVAESITEVLR
ncbi:MAG: Na/Pi cotransporter family protein [Clostridia bacterium]|nr:Na/Pi cotransporter family protein [Clostridia bacterium]